jgi:hypothetical protein
MYFFPSKETSLLPGSAYFELLMQKSNILEGTYIKCIYLPPSFSRYGSSYVCFVVDVELLEL